MAVKLVVSNDQISPAERERIEHLHSVLPALDIEYRDAGEVIEPLVGVSETAVRTLIERLSERLPEIPTIDSIEPFRADQGFGIQVTVNETFFDSSGSREAAVALISEACKCAPLHVRSNPAQQ